MRHGIFSIPDLKGFILAIMHQTVYAPLTQSWTDWLDQLQQIGISASTAGFRQMALAGLQPCIKMRLGIGYQLSSGLWEGEESMLAGDLMVYDEQSRPLLQTPTQVCLPQSGLQGLILCLEDTPAAWVRLETTLVELPAQHQLLALWFPDVSGENEASVLQQLEECGALLEQGQMTVLMGDDRLWMSRGYGSNFGLIPVASVRAEALEAFVEACAHPFKKNQQQPIRPKQLAALSNKRIQPKVVRTPSDTVLPLGIRHNTTGQQKTYSASFAPCPTDPRANFPLHTAVIKGDVEQVTALLREGHTPNCKNKEGNSPLHLLVETSADLEIAELLIMAGADLNVRNHICVAPLHLAVLCKRAKMLQWLLDQGAEIEARNNRAYTPLHKAVVAGDQQLIEILLQHQADIHARMEKDIQPLHLAAWYGHEKLIDFLLERGADINAVNDDGNSALHFAAFNGQVKVIKRLVQLSANAGLTNALGDTYLQGINEGYQGAMIQVLA